MTPPKEPSKRFPLGRLVAVWAMFLAPVFVHVSMATDPWRGWLNLMDHIMDGAFTGVGVVAFIGLPFIIVPWHEWKKKQEAEVSRYEASKSWGEYAGEAMNFDRE